MHSLIGGCGENNKQERLDPRSTASPLSSIHHPSEVVADAELTLNEKRAILASWASDACALDGLPELRRGRTRPIPFDEIMEALRSLDRQARNLPDIKRLQRKRRFAGLQRPRLPGSDGHSSH